jgi:cation transport ATPase
MENIEERLKELDIEDFIWIIYIGIIILSFYANIIERKYFIEKDQKSCDQYRLIMFIIFLILIIVYGYTVIESIKGLKKNNSTFQYMVAIASILIFISGILYLIIIIYDENIETEIAFN